MPGTRCSQQQEPPWFHTSWRCFWLATSVFRRHPGFPELRLACEKEIKNIARIQQHDKSSFVFRELRAFSSPILSYFFFPLKWADLKRKLSSLLGERALKYPEAPMKRGSTLQASVQFSTKVRGQLSFQGGSQGLEIISIPAISGKPCYGYT